jgi:tetratricopeptide (TPR) repeat protein
MTDSADDNDIRRKKRFRYFLLAYACLFFGALFSGADGAFFGIGFAAGLFFFFMALMTLSQRRSPPYSSNRPGPPPSQNPQATNARRSQSQATTPPGENILERILAVLRAMRARYNVMSSDAKAKVFSLVFISGMIMFFLIVFFTIDSDDETSGNDFVIEEANRYYDLGEYDSASLYYRTALQLDPTQSLALLGLGNVKLAREEYDSGLFYFNKILEVNPRDEGALNGKGLCYFYSQRYDDAIEQCKEILALNSSNADALLLMGDCFYNQEQYDSAIRYYEPGYELGRRSRLLCHIMAYIYDKKGQIDKAIPLYEEALTYDTTIVDIYKRLSEIAPAEKANYYRQKMEQLPR